MANFNNIIGTLLKENITGVDEVLEFPNAQTTGGFMQVQTISGTVEVKGSGRVFGQPSTYIPLAEGQFMNFAAVGNINPLDRNFIKLAPGAIVTLIAYD